MPEKSPGAVLEEEKRDIKPQSPPSPEESEALGFYLRRAQEARNMREQEHREFDGMSYMKDYQANMDAANTYLQPKVNADEVRVNTATSEKKIEAIMNELLSMNIQHEVHAFDRDDAELTYLGKDIEHLITRTNQIEREDDFWVDFVRELLTQRAAFIKEEYCTKTTRRTDSKNYTKKQAQKVLLPGRKVYLGDIYIPAYKIQDQPYIIEYDRMSYRQAKTLFEQYDNFQHVVPGGTQSMNLTENDLYSWRMHSLEQDEVEVLRYYSYPDNEYQIIVNGVMMLPLNTPLPWEHEGYNITMITIKPIRTNFAYGKSPLSSAKTLQALENEMTRNMIRKFRQSIEPPLVSMQNALFTRDMFNAGAITQGIDPDKLKPLLKDGQINQGEFAMINLINQKVQEFIGVSNLQQGISDSNEKTATEALEQLRQGLKMMGLAILAMIRARINVSYLRTYTILEEYSKPQGTVLDEATNKVTKKYLQFTVKDVELDNNRRGDKVIKFLDRDLSEQEEESIYKLEEEEAKKGRNIRLKTINAKKLREFPLFFFITAHQKEREGSPLQKMMFQQELAQATAIEQSSQGQVRVDWQSAAEKMERTWGTRNLFQKRPPTSQQQGMQGEVQQQAGELINQLDAMAQQTPGVPRPPRGEQVMESVRQRSRPQPSQFKTA